MLARGRRVGGGQKRGWRDASLSLIRILSLMNIGVISDLKVMLAESYRERIAFADYIYPQGFHRDLPKDRIHILEC